jgi:VWFA-related protein
MRTALALALGSLVIAPVAPAPAAGGVAGSDNVVLDFVVKDKKGVVVPDLKLEEIEVYENGSRRPVESLRFVSAAAAPATGAEGAPQAGQLVSLVFDGLDQNQQKLAQQAARDLLGNALGPDTWIAVFRIGLQLWTVQPFTRDLDLVRQAVDKAASTLDSGLAEPDARARVAVADTLAQLSQGKTTDPAAVARAEVLGKIIRAGDRMQRQRQDQSPTYLLMAVAKGHASTPGRKTIVYFSTGFEVPGLLDDVFKAAMSEANRANVAFYGVGVGGLDTTRQGDSSRAALEKVAKTSIDQAQQTSGAVSRDEMQLAENVEASTRVDTLQPLKELSESTGGFATINTNDFKKAMGRVAADFAGYYELTYAPESQEYDGKFRKLEVKVARGGAKVQHPNGYIATPPDETGPILAYELPLLEALKAAEPKKDFPITVGAFRFGTNSEGRDVTLVAELPMSSFKFTTDPKTKLYKLHFALLAVVKDAQGKVVERVSQDYPFQGPLDTLPQLQQGKVIFKRRLAVPPGAYTVELVARDRESAATSVHRMPLGIPPARGLELSSVVIVRKLEQAPPVQAGAPEDPLRGEAMRIVPALDDPISKATTTKLPVFLIVYAAPGGGTPQMTIEFSADGKAEGRSSVVLPAADPDGRIRFLAPIPIERFGPGRHELKVTVHQGSEQADEKLTFTLQP